MAVAAIPHKSDVYFYIKAFSTSRGRIIATAFSRGMLPFRMTAELLSRMSRFMVGTNRF
jgi:hypothetical protein